MTSLPLLRKHIAADQYAPFTQQFPLFEQIALEEQKCLHECPEKFTQKYPETLLFPDPFFQPRRLRRRFPLKELRIIAAPNTPEEKIALTFAGEIRSRWGFEIPVLTDEDPSTLLRSKVPLLCLGGAASNRATLEIAKKYQLGLFSSEFPGPGGWGITTHWELEPGAAPCYILAAEGGCLETALAYFLGEGTDNEATPALKWIHHVTIGDQLRQKFGDFRTWLSLRPFISRWPALLHWLEQENPRPFRELFRDYYFDIQRDYPEARKGEPTGLPNTEAPLILGLLAGRFYQMTSDPDALDLFREAMLGFILYLQSPNPTIYPSGLDFKIGNLCNLWSWIEHHPAISAEEREQCTVLLLALVRMVRDYFRGGWKKRAVLDGPYLIPQNHETFKAGTLAVAWRYFRRWQFPDLDSWKEEADAIFSRIHPGAFKNRENAGNYETYVPEHILVWAEATNRSLSHQQQESLAGFALRDWMLRDNFFFPVDYGDCDPKLEPSRPLEVGPWLTGDTPWQQEIRNLESSCHGLFPWEITGPTRYFTGLQTSQSMTSFRGRSGWQLLPMDPNFARQNPVQGTTSQQFDKLCWRSGWQPASAYMALEGVGNVKLSHAHNEANGILRMNMANRIWIFTNGYGRQTIMQHDAARSFSTRNRGPEEHNMLIVRSECSQASRPPFNALLQSHGDSLIPHSISNLLDYNGVDWRRYLFILPNIGFFSVDRVRRSLGATGPLPAFELQWNLMGERREVEGTTFFSQEGIDMEVNLFNTARVHWQESPIATWRTLVKNGSYPWTRATPSHGILTPMQQSPNSQEHYFVSGFWLRDSLRQTHWEKTTLILETKDVTANGSSSFCEGDWGLIEKDGRRITITLNPS